MQTGNGTSISWCALIFGFHDEKGGSLPPSQKTVQQFYRYGRKIFAVWRVGR